MGIHRTAPPAALDAISRGIDQAIRRLTAVTGRCTYGLYRRPVVRFLERRLPAGANAAALADEVLASVLDPKLLHRADREGRGFRELLLAVTRYHLYRQIRIEPQQSGDGRPLVSFDDLRLFAPGSDEERRDFEGLYAGGVASPARDALRQETTVRSTPAESSGRCECPCPRCAGLRESGAGCTCTCGPCTGRKTH